MAGDSGGPSGEQDPQVTRALLAALDRVPELHQRAHLLGDVGPARDSPATLDEAMASFGENGWALAFQAWLVASDHALAWQRLLRAGQQPIAAHVTLLRSVFENAALCRWLVEPSITQAGRLQRAAAAQLDDYEERRKFEQAIGSPQASGTFRPARERLTVLRRAMKRAGVSETKFPGYMALVRDHGMASRANAEWLYRLLSAFAHGKQWAILAGTLGPVARAPGTQRLRQARLSADDNLAVVGTQLAIRVLERALTELTNYAGRPTSGR